MSTWQPAATPNRKLSLHSLPPLLLKKKKKKLVDMMFPYSPCQSNFFQKRHLNSVNMVYYVDISGSKHFSETKAN